MFGCLTWRGISCRHILGRARKALFSIGLHALVAGWSAHDLRRSFSTRLNAMGVAPHVVERALNHSLGSVMAVYNKATYEPERQTALDAWARELGRLATVSGSNVIELPAQRERAA